MPKEPPTLPVSTRSFVSFGRMSPRNWFFMLTTPCRPGRGACSLRPRRIRRRRARLHRRDDQAGVVEVHPHDVSGVGEGFGHLVLVAVVEVELHTLPGASSKMTGASDRYNLNRVSPPQLPTLFYL